MKQLPANKSSSPGGSPLLYRLVFERSLVRFFVVVLVCSFLLQTIERAYANEPATEPAPNLPVTITDEAVATIQDEFSQRTEPTAEPAAPEVVSDAPGASEPLPETVPPAEPSEPAITIDAEPVVENPPTDPAPETTLGGEETVPTDILPVVEVATTTDTGTSTATTTDPTTPTLTVESDQMIQFNKDNCLAVEDGSFYCQIATTTPATR